MPSSDFQERDHRSIPRKTLQAITFYGLLLVIVAAAFPYGEVNSPLQLIYASLIYVLCAGRAIESQLYRSPGVADKTLVLLVTGFLIIAVLQVLPLPFLSSINQGMPAGYGHISRDRYSTVNFLLLFGSLVTLGETLLHLTNTRKRLVAITATVLIVGLGSALFGVGRHAIMSGDGSLLSIQVIDVAPAQYAQFLNRNHFALLVEMTLGVLLGLLLKARLSTGWKVGLGLSIAVCWFAIISANSRGGIMSSGGVIIFGAFMHLVTRGSGIERDDDSAVRPVGRRLKLGIAVTALIVVLSGALIVSVALIGGETTVSRFEKTGSELATVDGRASRLEIWHSTMRLIAAYPLIGSGFGAYAIAITPYDTASGGGQVIRQAHNEYLEIVAGGGVVAAVLMLLFLGLIVRRAVQRFNDRGRLEKAIGFGAVLGLWGVFLHSFVDFGLHVQINSLVFVLLIVLATAPLKNRRRRTSSADDTRSRNR